MSDCDTHGHREIGFITEPCVDMDKFGVVSMRFCLAMPLQGKTTPITLYEKDVEAVLNDAGVNGPADYGKLEKLPCFYGVPETHDTDCVFLKAIIL